jgi:hypothetical protein
MRVDVDLEFGEEIRRALGLVDHRARRETREKPHGVLACAFTGLERHQRLVTEDPHRVDFPACRGPRKATIGGSAERARAMGSSVRG